MFRMRAPAGDCSVAGMRETRHIRLVLGVLGVSVLPLISRDGRASTSGIARKCEVFSSARDRARCVCALEQGGRVTEVHDKWRCIYPRRHKERHCHGLERLTPSELREGAGHAGVTTSRNG